MPYSMCCVELLFTEHLFQFLCIDTVNYYYSLCTYKYITFEYTVFREIQYSFHIRIMLCIQTSKRCLNTIINRIYSAKILKVNTNLIYLYRGLPAAFVE